MSEPTGGFRVGQRVEWRHIPRGGYGHGYWVPAVIVGDKRGAISSDPFRRVSIDAERKDGTYRRRSVQARNLRDAEFADRRCTDCGGEIVWTVTRGDHCDNCRRSFGP